MGLSLGFGLGTRMGLCWRSGVKGGVEIAGDLWALTLPWPGFLKPVRCSPLELHITAIFASVPLLLMTRICPWEPAFMSTFSGVASYLGGEGLGERWGPANWRLQ